MAVNDPLTSLEQLITSQQERKSRIQAIRLFRNMFGSDQTATMNRDDVNELLSSAFLISEHMTTLCANEGYRAPIASFGAEVLEDIGSIRPADVDPDVLSFFTYSSMNYFMTRKFANSKLLALQHLNNFPVTPTAVRSTDQFRLLIHKAILLLLATKLDMLRDITSKDCTRQLAKTLVGNVTVSELTSGLMTLRSLNAFANYLDYHQSNALENAHSDLKSAIELGRTDLFIGELTEWLLDIYDVCLENYAPRYLTRWKSLPLAYLNLLTLGSHRTYWLWPSQTGALEAGLLEYDSFAVSLPPSAGKTFLAELKIVQRIAHTDKLAFYVVPLNALARQARSELAARLRQAPLRMNIRVLTGTYEVNDEDLAGAGVAESVIITTPEKLDGLLRNIHLPDIKAMFDRAELFIFDECQNIGSGKRGVTLEMLIERVRFQKPDASILGSAAFFSNIQQFANWLGNPDTYYRDDWRPTRRQVASWSKSHGLLIDRQWQVKGYSRSTHTDADVTRIAIDLQRVYENVLVVATSRQSAEKYAGRLAAAVSKLDRPLLSGNETKKLQILAEAIRESIHPQARLADYVGYGVAYHHARLPASVKSQIEDYISDGTLKLIASTTTLAQGVNFPIRCVVLSSIFFGPNPMKALDLQNIIGRAGRAGVSTTGQVIIIRNNEWVHSEGKFHRFDDYCFSPPPQLLSIASSLPTEVNASPDRQLFERNETLDSQLLAFLGQSGFQVDDQIQLIAEGTFLAKQNRSAVDQFQDLVRHRLTRMEQAQRPLVQAASPYTLTQFGDVVRKTGLGSTATRWIVQELEQVLESDADTFSTIRLDNNEIDNNKLKSVLGLMLFDPSNLLDSFAVRNRSKELFGVPISKLEQNVESFLSALDHDEVARDIIRKTIYDADLEFLSRWINGANYSDLAEFFLKKSNPTQVQVDQAIEEAIYAVDRYGTLLSWSAYYISLLLDHLLEEKSLEPPSPELKNLAYYVRWGVNHPVAVFVRDELNWGTREDALALNKLGTPELAYAPNKDRIGLLLDSVDDEKLMKIFGQSRKADSFRSKISSHMDRKIR